MKKLIALLLSIALLSVCAVSLADGITIAVPNDNTNEGRALLLLQSYGIITLREDAGITATPADIVDNPYNISFAEVEAAAVPNYLEDAQVDYAIINNNYALDYYRTFLPDRSLVDDALLVESADSPYVNVVCVNEGNENTPEAKALAAAVLSQQVYDYINENYGGAAVAVAENPTDGYDPDVDYEALAGTTITIICSPTPHAQILALVKDILAAKGITLEITEVVDYVTPNLLVDAGDAFANYFAHVPYQDDFNQENGTHLVSIAGVHVEPMTMLGASQKDLSALGIEAK